MQGEAEWDTLDESELETAHYFIPVDEFAEVVIPGRTSLTRDELRTLCDIHKTKEAIIAALHSR